MSQDQQQSTTLITNYEMGKTIGQGTFSKVKLAIHIPTSQQVAIKIIQKDKITSENDQIRLIRQLKILRKVRHPHIAQLYQIIQSKKYIFLVTEYSVKGELFDHIVQQEKLPEFEASKFLLQLMSAVEYIHALGIVHRDLKPENLLLDQKYNLKLIDFGLSNVYSDKQLLKTACGSPCYAAPQMIKGQHYSGLKTDIWSCGVVLYAMCFGYLPFDDPETSVLYQKIKEGTIQIPSHASLQLRDLFRIILEVDPAKRATIKQIRQHPFCQKSPYIMNILKNSVSLSALGIIVGLSQIPYQEDIEKKMQQMKIDTNNLKQSIKNNKHNDVSVSYYLILQRSLRLKNQCLVHYYHAKNQIINKYQLIQKVKENYDHKRQKYQLASSTKKKIKQTHKTKQTSPTKRNSSGKGRSITKKHQREGKYQNIGFSRKLFTQKKKTKNKKLRKSQMKKVLKQN